MFGRVHSDPDQNAKKRIESGSDNQSGDSRTWERNRAAVVVDTREQEEVVLEEMSKLICRNILALGPGGVLPDGTKEQSEGSGNECGFEGVGQSLGPWRRKVPLTQGGGSSLPPGNQGLTWSVQGVDEGHDKWEEDGQEFPKLQPRQTTSKCIGSADPDDTGREENHGMDTRSRLPGLWTGGCGRQSAVRPWEKETGMFSHGLFRVP